MLRSPTMPSDLYDHAYTNEIPKKHHRACREVIGAIMCCVVGIIIFSLVMGTDSWYWGIIAGVGGFCVLRAFYGCYMANEERAQKPPSAPLNVPVEVVISNPPYKLEPIYDDDPQPPTI